MTWRLTAYIISLFVATGLCTTVAAVLWRRRRTAGGLALILALLGAAAWTLTAALEALTPDIAAKIVWSKLEYVGIGASGTLFFFFAAQYTHSDQWLDRRVVSLFSIEPLATVLIATTNEWHRLLWSQFALDTSSGDAILVYGHAPWFYINAGYNFAFTFLGMFLLVRYLSRSPRTYRAQTVALLTGALAPPICAAIYMLGLSPLRGLDFSPFAFVLTGLAFAWNVLHYRLLDLVPIARDALIENMTDGVLVFDAQNRLIDVNPAARHLLDLPLTRLGQTVDGLNTLLSAERATGDVPVELVWNHPLRRYLDARVVQLFGQERVRTGCLIVLRDITRRKQMESALQEANANLECAVAERTATLQTTVDELQNEIVERTRVEQTLRRMEQDLAQRVANASRNLAALYEIILYAGQSLTIDQIQDQALATIMAVMNADAGCAHEWDEPSRTLRLRVPRGLSPAMQAQIETIPGPWLLSEKITQTVTELATHPDVPASVRLPLYRSYLGAPIYLLDKPIGSLGVFWSQARSFAVEDIALFSAMADQLAIIVENARLRERGEAAAVLKERRRLARELHDSVTQSLHSLVLAADTAHNRLQQGKLDRLELSLNHLSESARQALKEMRLLLFEMRLVPLDQVNIVEALQLRLDAVEKRAGLTVQFTAERAVWPPSWEQELYCIAIEALNNSLKHSSAGKVTIRLTGDGRHAELEIADNGKGITPADRRPGGLGLSTMAERAERIGGTLTITSAPGAGTRIHVQVQEDT